MGLCVCAGTGIATTPLQHPLELQFTIKANPGGVPSPLIPVTSSPPMDAARRMQPPLPPLCPRRTSPRWFHPPLLPLQAVFLLLSSFHQAANMLSEQ